MNELESLLAQVGKYINDPTNGLPEEIFRFATQITPMVNVDLLVRDKDGRILLSWRDDKYEGCGWHVPGGIVRVKETFEQRIQRTALQELGNRVVCDLSPLEIVPIIKKEKSIRGHFISFVYACYFPDGVNIEQTCRPNEAGYLKWFNYYPDDMLPVHAFYKKYFNARKSVEE